VAEVMLSPNDPRFPRVELVITKYAYDPTRALALLREAGWTRSASGGLINAAGEPFTLDIRTTAQIDNETELSIIASDLSRLGMQISQTIVPQSRIRDSEYRIKFPGLNTTARSIDIPGNLEVAISAQCPDPERRYSGANRGCWQNAEFDRLFLAASTSLDRTERETAIAQALKILTEELGIVGLSYNSENIAVRKGLVGPGPRWPSQVGNTWNIHTWRWQ
jgi:peptide/nickel transport system substrate-binding protein